MKWISGAIDGSCCNPVSTWCRIFVARDGIELGKVSAVRMIHDINALWVNDAFADEGVDEMINMRHVSIR